MFMHFGCAMSKVHLLFLDVTSSGGAMTSCVTSRHRMFTGHMTFCYKRAVNASFEALLALLARLTPGSSIRFTLGTRIRLVSNTCRSQRI